MTSVLATVGLPHVSGNPADEIQNDFAFDLAGALDSAAADAIETWLTSFYNTVQVIPGTDAAPATYLSSAVSRTAGAASISMYDITGFEDGSPHGSPLFVRNWTVGATTGTSANRLPEEVAIKLSIHGDLDGIVEKQTNPLPPPAFIRPAARRRGGIYLGPLPLYALASPSDPRPSTDLKDTLAAAAAFLLGEAPEWSVWSRADATLYPVVGGWIDNAFDTQRRRGPEMTSRVLWP